MAEIPTAQVLSFFVGNPDPDAERTRRMGTPAVVVTVRRAAPYTEDAWRVERSHPAWYNTTPRFLSRGALSGGGFWMSHYDVINPRNLIFTLDEALVAANEAITRVIGYK